MDSSPTPPTPTDSLQEKANKYRSMFDYSLSQPWHPIENEWSSSHRKNAKYIQHPILFSWNNDYALRNDLFAKRKRINY